MISSSAVPLVRKQVYYYPHIIADLVRVITGALVLLLTSSNRKETVYILVHAHLIISATEYIRRHNFSSFSSHTEMGNMPLTV